MPASFSRTLSGRATVPATAVSAGLEISSSAGDHVAKSFQPSLNDAPAREVAHVPTHAASGADTESWIAVASRSRRAPLSAANCVEVSPAGRFGVHAKPRRVPADRIAYVCADT